MVGGPAPSGRPSPGVRSLALADFERVERLGEGAEGEVLEGRERGTGLRVVLKRVPPEDRIAVERAFATLCRVGSPHLPAPRGLARGRDGETWLVTAFVEGEPLAPGPVDPATAVGEARALAHALRALHTAGTHHGDLSPANVVRAADGTLTVIDLGQLGRLATGSPGFIAPEVLAGGGGAAADRFALGCILCVRLFGEVPWRRPEAVLAVRGRAEVEAALVRLGAQALPRSLRSLLVRLLDPDPSRRPHDTGDVLTRLGEIEAELRASETTQQRMHGGPVWWIPRRWPYRGSALDAVVARLAGSEPPRLVAIAGPEGAGRGRIVEEIVARLQALDHPARLVLSQQLGERLGLRDANWLDAWMGAAASEGVLGCVDAVPWPGEYGTDPAGRALVLATAARLSAATLVLPTGTDVAARLDGPGVLVLAVRPWSPDEVRALVDDALEGEGAAAWAEAIAKATGGWPAAVVRALEACARLAAPHADAELVEAALERAGDPHGWTIDRETAIAVMELRWHPDPALALALPAHLHDGRSPWPAAVVAARRALGDELVPHARAHLGTATPSLALGVDADDAQAIEQVLAPRAALTEAEPAANGVLAWLEAGGAARVGPHVRVLAARRLLRSGEARRALALVEHASDPRCRIEAARALQRLGRVDEALALLPRAFDGGDAHGGRGLRWRLLVDRGEAAIACAELLADPPHGDGLGPATAMLWGGYAAMTTGDTAEARTWLGRARTALGAANDDLESAAVLARVLQLLGNLEHAEGDLHAASEGFARAAEAFAAAEEGVGALLVRGSLASLAIPTLDVARGLEHARATVRGLLARGQVDALPEAVLNLVQLLVRIDALEQAEVEHRALVELVRAFALPGTARARGARIEADLAAARMRRSGTWDHAALEDAYVRAASALAAAKLSREAADTWLRAAAIARNHGRASAARSHWHAARDAAGASPDRHTEAGLAIEAVRIAARADDPAALDAALSILHATTTFAVLRAREELELAWAHDLAVLDALRVRRPRGDPARVAIARRLLTTLETIMTKTRPLDRNAVASTLADDGGKGLDAEGSTLASILAELDEAVPTESRREAPSAGAGPRTRGDDPVRLERLLRMYRRFAREERLEILLEQVVDAVMDLTEAERGAVLVQRQGAPRLEVTRELARESEGFRWSQSVIERVLTTGEPILSVDAAADERFDGSRSISHLNLRSVLAVPLRFRGAVLGAIYVDHRLRRGNFDADDLAHVEEFAELAALAVAHAEALAEVRAQSQALAAQGQELARLLERREAEVVELREEVRTRAPERGKSYRGIVGRSAAMQAVFRLIDRLGDAAVPVVIHGESGTGKEMVARAIHASGSRASGPFVAENCGAIPETLLESVLFGHAKGAFTGAHTARPGLFEAAHGGTIFLDEVGETSPAMQTKLLRVLQEGEVRRVGENQPRKVDVRVIAASNRDLEAMVKRGAFRQDLYYRINVVRLDLPPLRERSEDIPALVEHFATRHAPGRTLQLSAAARRALAGYAWPGNVRELENEVQRWSALTEGVVDVDDLSPAIAQHGDGLDPDDLRLRPRVDRFERELILRALERTQGNQTRAAELLGLSRFGLQKKLQRWQKEGLVARGE